MPPIPFKRWEIESVAVITPYFIGDTLISTVLIENLIRQCSPETVIYTISDPPHQNLIETIPGLTGSYSFPKTLQQKRDLIRQLRCDTVFLLRFSIPWAAAVLDAGVRYRIGFDLERFGLYKLKHWGGLLTHSVPSGTFDASEHQMTFYKRLMEAIGFPWIADLSPHIYLTPEDMAVAHHMLAGIHGPRILIHASAGSPGKKWPEDHWAELLIKLHSQYHASFIAVGTDKDIAIYESLWDRTGVPIHNFCGKTTLRQTAALCRFTECVLTLDTAIAHIAAAVETPNLIVLYGPTNLSQWKPIIHANTQLKQIGLDVPCRPCITRTCYHRACLRLLSVERVFHAVSQAIDPKDCILRDCLKSFQAQSATRCEQRREGAYGEYVTNPSSTATQ